MAIVGFGFDKILVNKKETKTQYKVQNNINVISLSESKLPVGKEDVPVIKITFDYLVDYEEAGKVELSGYVMYLDVVQKIKEILEKWKKDEKMPTEFGASIYNFIINRVSVKALQLEEDIGFPLHISLPKIMPKK